MLTIVSLYAFYKLFMMNKDKAKPKANQENKTFAFCKVPLYAILKVPNFVFILRDWEIEIWIEDPRQKQTDRK